MALSTFRLLASAAVAAGSLATQVHAATAYSLSSNGTSLIRFDTATPGAVTTVGAISGAIAQLDGLDFRPSNGLLYGYNHATGSAYSVNTGTGAATFAALLSTPTNGPNLGIDFNPVPDRLRIVTDIGQNLRVNLAGGATTVDGVLAYAAGDPNFGAVPRIIDVAYTNSSLGVAASTVLYYLDYTLNNLVTTSNPNAGVLNTVGSLGVDFDLNTGFDIFTNGGVNNAFGALRVGGVNGLYSINLATGAATLQGAIGDTSLLYGLAIVPGIPEPGTVALWGVAGLFAIALRRRLPAPAATQ